MIEKFKKRGKKMSNNKKLMGIMMALCMSASVMTACQSKEEPPQEPPVSTEAGDGQEEGSEQQNAEGSEQVSESACTITIQDFCTDKQFEIESGDTVYDVLKKTEVDMGATNSGDGIFVDGINGKYAGDEGETSGWVYTVNGERPEESCDKYEVKAGDVIVWEYVTE